MSCLFYEMNLRPFRALFVTNMFNKRVKPTEPSLFQKLPVITLYMETGLYVCLCVPKRTTYTGNRWVTAVLAVIEYHTSNKCEDDKIIQFVGRIGLYTSNTMSISRNANKQHS